MIKLFLMPVKLFNVFILQYLSCFFLMLRSINQRNISFVNKYCIIITQYFNYIDENIGI